MKSLICLAVSLLIAAVAHAETKFPRGTFAFTDFEKAKEQAAKDKKDIAFIYTDELSTCGLCQNATAEFIDAVKSKAVIVHVDSKATREIWAKLPAAVRTALTPGKFIPKMVITDATGEKVSASLNYDQFKVDSRKSIRALKKDMRAE